MGFFSGKSNAEREYEDALRDYYRSVAKRGQRRTDKDRSLSARVERAGSRLGDRRAADIEWRASGTREARRSVKRNRADSERLRNQWLRDNPGIRYTDDGDYR